MSERLNAKFVIGDDTHRGLVHCWVPDREDARPIATAYVGTYEGVNVEVVSYDGRSLVRLLHMLGDEVQRQLDIVADMPDIDPGWVTVEVVPVTAEVPA